MMYLGPLAVTAMALLHRAESWMSAALTVAAYSLVAFIPMTLDSVSADIAGTEPERTLEERRAIRATGLIGIAAIILSFSFDSAVVTLGLCLLFTVATLAVVVAGYMSASGRHVEPDDGPAPVAEGFTSHVDVPAPVSGSAHHGLTRAGW